jgi:preprotein translocase subunit SecA
MMCCPLPACLAACRLEQYKWKAVVTEIKRIHREGRPVLVGTTSVEKSELLSEMLTQDGIKHQVGHQAAGQPL